MHDHASIEVSTETRGVDVKFDAGNAITIFKALSDPIRLRTLRLMTVNRTKMCVCELVDALEERQYNVSRHLRILLTAGLLGSRKEGRWVYYGLADEADENAARLNAFIAALGDVDQLFAEDQARFRTRMELRQDGRCRLGILNQELAGQGDR